MQRVTSKRNNGWLTYRILVESGMIIGWMNGGADECKENIDAEQCHPYKHAQTEIEYMK